jgi:hypothetical protein
VRRLVRDIIVNRSYAMKGHTKSFRRRLAENPLSRPAPSPPRLRPCIPASLQPLVEVAHHRGHRHVDLAIEEMVAARPEQRMREFAPRRVEARVRLRTFAMPKDI